MNCWHASRPGGQGSTLFQYDAVRARLPLAQIEALAARTDVKFIRSAAKMVTTRQRDFRRRRGAPGQHGATQFGVTGAA